MAEVYSFVMHLAVVGIVARSSSYSVLVTQSGNIHNAVSMKDIP